MQDICAKKYYEPLFFSLEIKPNIIPCSIISILFCMYMNTEKNPVLDNYVYFNYYLVEKHFKLNYIW